MPKKSVLFFLLFLACSVDIFSHAESSVNSPEYARDSSGRFKAADSYEEALQVWKTPEDIRAWIAANFIYDMERAMRLSETQRAKGEQLAIYTPSEFFATKAGMCVDLARFGVETLRHINPQSDPKYLMIEFESIQIAGNTVRLHWLASFKRDGKTYFFADSKRPGHIAGPYNDAGEFIQDYAQYRGRKIMIFREMDRYQKKRRTQALKAPQAHTGAEPVGSAP